MSSSEGEREEREAKRKTIQLELTGRLLFVLLLKVLRCWRLVADSKPLGDRASKLTRSFSFLVDYLKCTYPLVRPCPSLLSGPLLGLRELTLLLPFLADLRPRLDFLGSYRLRNSLRDGQADALS